MAYTLPVLPYAYDALEPRIDARTMEIHHTKHHNGYVAKLNAAIEQYPHLGEKPIEELLKSFDEVPDAIKTAVRNHGGGHANHSFFWQCMTPAPQALVSGPFYEELVAVFGSLDGFKTAFTEEAIGRFGSGWAWLVCDQQGNLRVMSTPNQDSPLMDGFEPLLGLDVWEHAYYLSYQNQRPVYIENWWHVVNWEFVAQRYTACNK